MINRKIVFIQPPVSLEEIYSGLANVGAVSPPMNLLLLAAIVRKSGYEPYIIDSPALGLNYKEIIDRVCEIGSSFIGITAMTPHIMQASKLAKTIKSELAESIVLLGGAHISAVPDETMKRLPEIDIGFIGEADHSLPEVLNAIQNSKPVTDVKGIICRYNRAIIKTGKRDDVVILDDLPFLAWDLLEGFPQAYKTPIFAAHNSPATPILTSRGCPGRCIFCYSGCHKTMSTYSYSYIFEMLKYLKENYGIREFMIYDDNFVMYKKNLKTLLNLMITEKMDLTWSCNARVDMVDEEVLNLMAASGCWQISYGIETGNQSILKMLEKNITIEKIENAIRLTHRAGIRTVGYFMIGHFSETPETIEETIKFAKSLYLDDFRMSFFTPLPGTKAAFLAENYGAFENDWGKMNLFSPVFIPHGMTKRQLEKSQKKALRRFFFRPRIIWSYIKMVKNPLKYIFGAYQFSKFIFGKQR